MSYIETLNIGSRRELFVDTLLLDKLEGAYLKLHEPEPMGPVIKNDRPWEGAASFGYSVIRHDGRYLMHYRGMDARDPNDRSGAVCVAESADGISWTKPELGFYERRGCKNTNIVVDESGNSCGGEVWYDTRPGVPENERIKCFRVVCSSGEVHTAYYDPPGEKRLVVFASANGRVFHKIEPQPTIRSNLYNCFDGGNSMFWSEAEKRYVLYFRYMCKDNGIHRRSVARMTSENFYDWDEAVQMSYSDTPEQFYTNGTQPYFRAPHIYIAPAARFMRGRQAITDGQAKDIGLIASEGDARHKDCSDGVLLTSRAGSTVYNRPFMETFIRPGIGYGNWTTRTNYPLTGIFPYDENRVMMFVNRHYLQDSWNIELLLLRTDGFASLSAPWKGGEMLTRPFIFEGRELEINYRTGASGFVRVEITDENGEVFPEYRLCREIIGDEISRRVYWENGADVSALSGRPVRLRFIMKDADIYSFKFN